MKILKTFFNVGVLTVGFAILAGCGKNETTSPNGLSINGVVYDISSNPASPAYSVTVTLRKAEDSSAIATATTGGDGSFTLGNVPASTDMYINVSKPTYFSFNDEIINISSAMSGRVLYIAAAANVQHTVDLIAWNDPSYAGYGGQSWFALDVYDVAGNEVSGVTVTPGSPDPTVLYNNGLDVFLPAAPTTVLSSHSSAPQVGGYNSSTGAYTFTLTDSSKSRSVRLPLVPGEMTYVSVYPW